MNFRVPSWCPLESCLECGEKPMHLVTGTHPAHVRVERKQFFLLGSHKGFPYPHGQRPAVHLEIHHINSFLTPQGNLVITQRSPWEFSLLSPHLSASSPSQHLCASPLRDGLGMLRLPSRPVFEGRYILSKPHRLQRSLHLGDQAHILSLMLRRVCKRFPLWVLLRSPSIP